MGHFMIPVCCVCGVSSERWNDPEWNDRGGLQEFCPAHAKIGRFTQYHQQLFMPTTPKSTGETIASNIHAAQMISGRDVERVAKQIDAGQAPLIKALEQAEEALTKARDILPQSTTMKAALKAARLALHAELTGAFQP
jgi:hypothetical protein